MMLSLSTPIRATEEGSEVETFTFLVNDVFSVALPIISRNCTVFDFIMDPQRVIEKSNAAWYEEGTFFEWNTLYFANMNEDGSLRGYSGTSDPLTVTNRSSMAVDVTLEAWLDLPAGVTLSCDPNFEGETSPSIYLALTDGRNTVPITYNGALLTVTVPAASDAYELVYDIMDDTRVQYYYTLTEQAMNEDYDGFPTYSFRLVGACNPNGNWEGLEQIQPTVTVRWTVIPQQSPPIIITAGVQSESAPKS